MWQKCGHYDHQDEHRTHLTKFSSSIDECQSPQISLPMWVFSSSEGQWEMAPSLQCVGGILCLQQLFEQRACWCPFSYLVQPVWKASDDRWCSFIPPIIVHNPKACMDTLNMDNFSLCQCFCTWSKGQTPLMVWSHILQQIVKVFLWLPWLQWTCSLLGCHAGLEQSY